MDRCSDRAEGEPWLLRRFDRADLDRCSREASGKGDRFRRRTHILPVCELQGGARELNRVQPRIDRGRTADPAVLPDAQPEQLAQFDRARGWPLSLQQVRTEGRREGKAWFSTGRSRWSLYT